MRTPLHLDLLKEEERYSSSPIRLRVMMPLTAIFAAVCILVWWALLCLRAHSQTRLEGELQQAIISLTPAHAAMLASRAQEQEFRAVVRQLTLYRNSRILFGQTLSNLGEQITENLQFTELRIPPPQPPAADPTRATLGPTNTLEQITLHISGRTGGERPSEAVNLLLAALHTPAFTNRLRTAVIPKGAFRQYIARNPENHETMLFEITCDCVPRRFE